MNENRTKLGRRGFIKIVAAAGTMGLAAHMGWDALQGATRVQETRMLMGTVVNLSVIGENREAAAAAVQSCFLRMAGLEDVFSRYRSHSQVSQLNRKGQLAQPHPDLVRVIHQALEISRLTSGKFDITINPLLEIYQQYQKEQQGLPPARLIEEALPRVDYRKVQMEDDLIRFASPGMSITLDGIAKGFIVDQGIEDLREKGFGNVLVEAGGDLAAQGVNQRQEPWRIGILSPREQEKLLVRIPVQDRALATSGDYQHHFSEDLKAHHIIDPQRGVSSPELASVTLLASSGMLADGFATAVMVLGVKRGKALVESIPGMEAFLVTKTLNRVRTSGLRGQDGDLSSP